jgi:hypothetical protein
VCFYVILIKIGADAILVTLSGLVIVIFATIADLYNSNYSKMNGA